MTDLSTDDPTCPTCGRDFSSRRGLGVHYATAHSDCLPNGACAHCGDRFYSEYAKKYCSERCLSAAAPHAGERNPNYRGGTTETTCRICGTAFEYYLSEKRGLYCSNCVETEQWRTVPSVRGSAHGLWKGGKQRHPCQVCGVIVERYPSNVGDVVLCSDECQSQWLSETFSGEGHPNWLGGGNESYGRGWADVRSRAFTRDEYQCVVCGVTREDLGRNPDVHHTTPVRWYIESDRFSREDAHFLENVVSLCVAVATEKPNSGRSAPSDCEHFATRPKRRPQPSRSRYFGRTWSRL
jgi:5-methylcytosine-specific restriction endonuclease McrA